MCIGLHFKLVTDLQFMGRVLEKMVTRNIGLLEVEQNTNTSDCFGAAVLIILSDIIVLLFLFFYFSDIFVVLLAVLDSIQVPSYACLLRSTFYCV